MVILDRELATFLSASATDALDTSSQSEAREEFRGVASKSDLLGQPQPLCRNGRVPFALVPDKAVFGD